MAGNVNPPGESPTVSGLFYMLIAGILIIVGLFVCGILSIIGYVIAIIGFFKIYGDRNAYPQPHPTNMEKSLVLYILGIVIIIIGVIILVAVSLSSVFSLLGGETTIRQFFDKMLFYLLISMIVTLIGGLCLIIARYKLLVELMPENLKGFLKFVMILLVLVSLIGMVSGLILFNSISDKFEKIYDDEVSIEVTIDNIDNMMKEFNREASSLSWLNVGLSLLSQVLFLLCFYFAWDYQKQNPRLRSGGQAPYPKQGPGGTPPYPGDVPAPTLEDVK